MPYIPERRPDPAEEKAKQRKAEEQRKLFRRVVVAASCLLIVYGAVRLIGYGAESAASRKTSRELQEIHEQAAKLPEVTEVLVPADVPPVTEAPTPKTTAAVPEKAAEQKLEPLTYPNNPNMEMNERFKSLRKKSEYIVGWLSMDGVEEAVVRKDNTFFLDHDAMGKKNSNGAIFLDEEISLVMYRPYTLILYGHNMKNGNMFGSLRKYKENAYAQRHRIITFDSLYEDGQYAVFAVLEFSADPKARDWFDLWSLDANDISEREEAIRNLEARSVHGSVLDVGAEDQLLLLVTCLDGADERLMVAARRLRDGETAESLVFRPR